MSEKWVEDNLFCPACSCKLLSFKANSPVADFECAMCGKQFELKTKAGRLPSVISDGAYETMISRITGPDAPHFLFMSYLPDDFRVLSVVAVPSYAVTPIYIRPRKALSSSARRAGWVGCNIVYGAIPDVLKVKVVEAGNLRGGEVVQADWEKLVFLRGQPLDGKGWVVDVLECLQKLRGDSFCLEDVYVFSDVLRQRHPSNRFIREKIRQQLQVLRDRGFVLFLGDGRYRLL